MKLPADTTIAKDKLTRYLLLSQARGDKSAFLARAGYTLENADQLLRDLRTQILPLDAVALESNKFGQYYETGGRSGELVDIPEVILLAELHRAWAASSTGAERTRIWQEMLDLHVDQQFTIGVIAGVPQPVVARDTLMNVPERGFYNWDPGAFFGIYRPDSFFFK